MEGSTVITPVSHAGDRDVRAAVEALAGRLPEPLAPLASLAYNFRWSWEPDGDEVFAALDPEQWRQAKRNPVRMLVETTPARLEQMAEDADYVERVRSLLQAVTDDVARPALAGRSDDRPVAFMCAEFGLHPSLPIYSGGLGVLAGDILKECSDLALPTVGVGLFYRNGYFHQRLDQSGWQHEYWNEIDPRLSPLVRVTGEDGQPLHVQVPVWDRTLQAQIWRVDVGRVPLYLLDTRVEPNSEVDEWITSRLYEGSKDIRLAQYTVLGIGGLRALRAMGITPDLLHLNEGHPALSILEMAAEQVAGGTSFDDATEAARQQTVFTTHTPVAAGNETYPPGQLLDVLPPIHERLGIDQNRFLGLCRVHPEDDNERAGMTPIALRLSRHVNGVSRRHGEVARRMWQELFQTSEEDTPIGHVTNGVHLPTWMGPDFRALFDRHLGDGWHVRADDPMTWKPVSDIPATELWQARTAARHRLIESVRSRTVTDRLRRQISPRYAEAPASAMDGETITIGFARRVAAYKRIYLLAHDVERTLRLFTGDRPIQFLFAGKAHPNDDGAKGLVKGLFDLQSAPGIAERVAFLEDYDMTIGHQMVTGCDVWVNVPRPPLEASGTSGMKVVLNGGLNLSVLDGWWAEGYDGTNGWAIDGEVDHDHGHQDASHATQLYDLLEHEVLPLFHQRDADGVPTGWVDRMRASLMTLAPQFCATRMMRDYLTRVYTPA